MACPRPQYDRLAFEKANPESTGIEFKYLDVRLDLTTAILASECEAVCIFVNDRCDAEVIAYLHKLGVVSTPPSPPPHRM